MKIIKRFTLIEVIVVLLGVGILLPTPFMGSVNAKSHSIRSVETKAASRASDSLSVEKRIEYSFDTISSDPSAPILNSENTSSPDAGGAPSSENSTNASVAGSSAFPGNTTCYSDTDSPHKKGNSFHLESGCSIVSYLDSPLSSSDFAFSIWIKPQGSLPQTGIQDQIVYVENPKNSYMRLYVSDTRIVFGDQADPNATVARSIPVNTWSQLTLTYSSIKNTVTGYINGKEVISYVPSVIHSALELPATIRIGLPISNGNPAIYNVDDFVLYDQSLTPKQVKNLYKTK